MLSGEWLAPCQASSMRSPPISRVRRSWKVSSGTPTITPTMQARPRCSTRRRPHRARGDAQAPAARRTTRPGPHRLIAETHGNPLALVELPRGLTPTAARGRVRPAGGGAVVRPDRGELHAAAREAPSRRAAPAARSRRRPDRRSGARVARGSAARDPRVGGADGRIGRLARARQPAWCSGIPWCARRSTGHRPRTSAARSTAPSRRRPIPTVDPDRRAWHRAQAASMPGRGRRRGSRAVRRSSAGAGRFRRRCGLPRALVRVDPRSRAARRAGPRRSPGQAAGGRARRGADARGQRGGGPAGRLPTSSGRRASRPDLLRRRSRERGAAPCCSGRGQRLEPLDARLAREIYLDALNAATVRRPPGRRLPAGWPPPHAQRRLGACAARGGSPSRRAGAADHRGARGRNADVAKAH